MRNEQKRIQSYRDNKKLEYLIRIYNHRKHFKRLLKGDALIQFESFINQVESNISKEVLDQLNIFDEKNPTISKKLGVSSDIIWRRKGSYKKTF